jgi:hypothetical protein
VFKKCPSRTRQTHAPDSTSVATLCHTTSGTTSTTSSTLYKGPITIASTELVEASAIATGYQVSTVSSKSGPITIDTAQTVIAIEVATGYNNSDPASKAYTLLKPSVASDLLQRVDPSQAACRASNGVSIVAHDRRRRDDGRASRGNRARHHDRCGR